ncbi:MAG: PilZ domain-containing protein [Novosphingobium sp.]|nr:PilZ domain-containing protein [Novosphingobium sp.]
MRAQCRTQSGLRDSGKISNISPEGCCVTTNGLFVKVGARVVVRPDGMEGLTGIIRWVEGQTAGVEFDAPIYPPVLDHLASIHAAGKPVGFSAC